jgi:hypothetical protein
MLHRGGSSSQRSRPASAASFFGELATTISGIFDLGFAGVFPVFFLRRLAPFAVTERHVSTRLPFCEMRRPRCVAESGGFVTLGELEQLVE